MKKNIGIALIVCIVGVVFTGCGNNKIEETTSLEIDTVETDTVEIISETKDACTDVGEYLVEWKPLAKKLYLDYIEEILDGGKAESAKYKLIYVDDNDIPELLIDYGYTAAGGELCYVSNGELKQQHVYSFGVSYIEKEDLFCDRGGHMDDYYDMIYKLKDGELEEIGRGDCGAEDNSDVQYDDEGNPIYLYYWNNAEVTKAEYDEIFKKTFPISEAKDPYEEMYNADEIIEQITNL